MKLTDTLLQLLIFNMPKMSSDNDIKKCTFKILPLYVDERPSTSPELEKERPHPKNMIHWTTLDMVTKK
jgi:hypothetical protein